MVVAKPTPATEQLPLPRLLGLFLVPGALMTVVFVVIAPFVETAGFPPIAALLVAILIVLLPFELGVLLSPFPRPSSAQECNWSSAQE